MENLADADRLVTENTGLVHACARRFTGKGVDYEDLYSCGCIGLVKAAKRFEPKMGFKFSTYAVPVILGEIKLMFRDTGALKVSRSLKELSLRVKSFCDAFEKDHGESPAVSFIAQQLGVSSEQVQDALQVSQHPVSLSCAKDEDSREIEIKDESKEEEITERLSLYQVLDTLQTADRRLIEERYFKGKTQQKTAEALGMTQVQVSRREKKILTFLREKMAC